MIPIRTEHDVRTELKEEKYSIVSGDENVIHPDLQKDVIALKKSWNTLDEDKFLKDEARFRLRRFGLFYFHPKSQSLIPMQAETYYQSPEVNSYAGGVERSFSPLLEETSENPFLRKLIKFNFRQFPVKPDSYNNPWKVDVHQFRIISTPDETGEPTPEGAHHDGDDFNVIHLIRRENVEGGVNEVYDKASNLLAATTLEEFMDSVYVWDPHVLHGVTPIQPKDSAKPGIRDVIVIGYNESPDLERPENGTKPL